MVSAAGGNARAGERARERLTRRRRTSRSGRTRSCASSAAALEPGTPGQFFMLEAPGRVLPRPFSLCLAPRGRARVPRRPDRARDARDLRARAGRRDPRARPARQRLRPRGRAAAPRRRRHRHRAVPVPLRARSAARRRCSASARRITPRRPRSSRTPRSCSTRRSSPSALPDDPGDVLACGPEPMLDAVARSCPGAQLAWEAPMACGYGACYGCVVPRDGTTSGSASRARCCSPEPAGERMTIPLLNASGCLDALDGARRRALARRVRDEDDHAAAARGQPARPDRRDRARDAQLDRPPGPGHRRVRRATPAAARGARASPLWVSVGGFSADDFALVLRAARRRRPRRGDRAQPLVPERRGGARDARRSSSPRRAAATSKPLYAKLSPAQWDIAECRARRRRRRRRRAVARQHDPRARARPGARCGRGSRAASAATRARRSARSRSPCVYACAAAVDVPIVGMGGVCVGTRRARARRGRRERRRARHGPLRRPARARRASGPSSRPNAPPAGSDRLRADRAIAVVRSRKIPANSRKRYCLIRGQSLLDSAPQWSRRRRTPRHPPGRSTSGWRPSSVRTTSASGVPS